jgi:hypothetical protein
LTYVEKLQAADWDVRDMPDRILLRRVGNSNDAWATVMKNADGMLHLVKDRSAFHRQLAADIAREPEVIAEGADYVPRTYGS